MVINFSSNMTPKKIEITKKLCKISVVEFHNLVDCLITVRSADLGLLCFNLIK